MPLYIISIKSNSISSSYYLLLSGFFTEGSTCVTDREKRVKCRRSLKDQEKEKRFDFESIEAS